METFISCCPFCGSHYLLLNKPSIHFWISCNICGAESGLSLTKAGAIESWNHRFWDIDNSILEEEEDEEL